MAQVFISYSPQDNDYARRLQHALEQRGFDVWLDRRIDSGARWSLAIQEELDASAAVIVLMTPSARQSTWVQNEFERARLQGKPIFALLLTGDDWLPLGLPRPSTSARTTCRQPGSTASSRRRSKRTRFLSRTLVHPTTSGGERTSRPSRQPLGVP